MLTGNAVRLLNHLLAGERWARERLRPFAGKTLAVEWGAIRVKAEVTADGFLQAPTDAGTEPTVHVALPDDTPLRLLSDPGTVFAQARISGPADFAEVLAGVFKNLRWDAEADLAAIVGDIAARRLTAAARSLFAWQRDALRRLTANTAEYLAHEQPVLTSSASLQQLASQIAGLNESLRALETRLGRL